MRWLLRFIPLSPTERRVLSNGNHLTNRLVNEVHPHDDISRLHERDYRYMFETYGHGTADLWAGWKAIMDWRDELVAAGRLR